MPAPSAARSNPEVQTCQALGAKVLADLQQYLHTCDMPMTLRQASRCWVTSGRVGATNTILPSGNHLQVEGGGGGVDETGEGNECEEVEAGMQG
eukprot:496796-Pelagomonas_calceolata.AAC.11